MDWITHDKGYGRRPTTFGEVRNPAGLDTIADYPNLTDDMGHAGWSDSRIAKITGENWLRPLGDVWEP